MRLASLHTYPVKGCYRLDHETAEVEPWGLAGDRRWLVIDTDGRAITQRDTPLLSQIRPTARPGGLLFRVAPRPGLTVPDLDVAAPLGSPSLPVTIWKSNVEAASAGDAADEWFSEVLDRKVRLVWLDDPTRRATNPHYSLPEDRVSFADGYPLLLTTLASLDAVNGWLGEAGDTDGPLPMTRFRPNVVVAGAPAWAEDTWVGRRLRIGGVVFRAVKTSSRCVVTTINQETGEKGRQPLRVLAKYRRGPAGVLFGLNLIPDGTGPISVGDQVEPLG